MRKIIFRILFIALIVFALFSAVAVLVVSRMPSVADIQTSDTIRHKFIEAAQTNAFAQGLTFSIPRRRNGTIVYVEGKLSEDQKIQLERLGKQIAEDYETEFKKRWSVVVKYRRPKQF